MQSESLKPSAHSGVVAPRVSARMNASDFAAVTKLSGTEDDQNYAMDRMDQCEAFVKNITQVSRRYEYDRRLDWRIVDAVLSVRLQGRSKCVPCTIDARPCPVAP